SRQRHSRDGAVLGMPNGCRSCSTLRCQPPKTNAPAWPRAGALSWMAGRLIATILENLEAAAALSNQFYEHALLQVGRFQSVLEFARRRDTLAVDFGNDVAGFDSFLFGDAATFNLGHDDAFGQLHFKLLGQFARQGLHLETNQSRFGCVLGPVRPKVLRVLFQHFARFDFDFDSFVVANDVERHLFADRFGADFALQVLGGRHFLAVHGRDDVGGLQVGVRHRAVANDAADHNAILHAGNQISVFFGLAQAFDIDAQPGAREFAVFDQLVGNF